MFDNSSLQGLFAWILTYAVHSTVLLAMAWFINRQLGKERLIWRERIWKTALLGGIVSASLQAAVNLAPLSGRLEWTHPVPFYIPTAEAAQLLPAAVAGPMGEIEFTWDRLLLGVWMLGGLLGVGLFLFAWRRIADRLAGRLPVRDGHAKRTLQALSKRAGLARPPRLTVSQELKSPATVGVFFPQICVPSRALVELSEKQQEALLAHELSHILRRDSAWFFLCGLIERTFFFQPLNRVARRDLQELAEFQCDDWAARHTANSLDLARCLTEVATWVLDERPVVAVVHMASSNSRLAVRIGRLLDEDRKLASPTRSRKAVLFPFASLFMAAVCLPGASAVGDRSEPPTVESPWTSGVNHKLEMNSYATSPEISTPAVTQPIGLEGHLAVLDRELSALYEECALLKRKYAGDPNPPFALFDIDLRVQRLRERQTRLQAILPALLSQPLTTTSRNPKQEESK